MRTEPTHRSLFRSRVARSLAALLACSLAIPTAARASWPSDRTVNVKVPSLFSIGTYQPRTPLFAIPDSGGGALVVIDGYVSTSSGDEYLLQRVDAFGNVRWGSGVQLPSYGPFTTNNWSLCAPVPDGAGGAWLATDAGTSVSVYQIRADGTYGPTVTVTPAGIASAWHAPVLVSDGEGGAVVVWWEYRSAQAGFWGQRVSISGTPMWTAGGARLNTTDVFSGSVGLVPDGAGGALLFLGGADVTCLSISGAGVRRTPAAGAVVCDAPGSQGPTSFPSWMSNRQPWAVTDGAGGAIAVWDDFRTDASGDLYAQRVDSLGNAAWTADGVPVCTRTGASGRVAIASDGMGGVIAAWQDSTHTLGGVTDIHAQRVDATGAARWATDGIPICAASGSQTTPAVTTRTAGGAILAWVDPWDYGVSRNDIRAQALDLDGNALWLADGTPVCSAPRNQGSPVLTPVGDHAAIAFWEDKRDSVEFMYSYSEVYAQYLPLDEGALLGVEPPPGLAPLTRLRVAPNPAAAAARVAFARDASTHASLELLDIAGRVARTRDLSAFGPGMREVTLDGLDALPAGVYLVRIAQGERTDTARLLVTH